MRHGPPAGREWSNGKDAWHTSQEMGVRFSPSRSIPKTLEVTPVSSSVVRPMVERYHYLHSMPAAARYCFGVYLAEELVGAAVFTAGARQGHRLLVGAKPQDVVTLARFYLTDAMPRNSESRVLGIVLRHFRRQTGIKLVLSYSDPAAGHVGTVYQASGWLYLGQTEPNSYVDVGDGRLHHPRSIYTRYGSNNVRHLRATGVTATRVQMPGKHRYVYPLDRSWLWRLRHQHQPYPSGRGRSPP